MGARRARPTGRRSTPALRGALFPRAKLALLYSGTMGRAHEFDAFLQPGARLPGARGRRDLDLLLGRAATAPTSCAPRSAADDTNIALRAVRRRGGRCSARLAAADLHLVSLRADWAGVVVPSKFFASLAVGPVIVRGAIWSTADMGAS